MMTEKEIRQLLEFNEKLISAMDEADSLLYPYSKIFGFFDRANKKLKDSAEHNVQILRSILEIPLRKEST